MWPARGTLAVVVTNPASCTNAVCASNSVNLSVAASAAPTPAPILSSISPTTASAGGRGFYSYCHWLQLHERFDCPGQWCEPYDNIRLVDAAHGGPSGQRCRRRGDSEHHRIHSGSGRRHVRSALADRRERESHADHHQSESGQRDGRQCRLHAHGHWHRLRRRRDRHGGRLQARTVTVDSATQVRIAVQATDVASQGTLAVVVTNPASCTNAVCASNSVDLSVAASSTSSTPTSPVLYFTDLASGPRSGNGDTSKGQIANQDGALVTVWGQNLGTSQGTSTITLGA